jgi:hypothetical protein
MKSLTKTAPQVDPILLASLYGAEFALVLIGLALNKLAGRPLAAWPSSGAGLAFFAGAAVLVIALALVGRSYLTRTGSRGFGFTVAMNLITLALVVMPLEIALRVLSRDSADAPIFGDTALLPRSWDKAAEHNRQQMDKAGGTLTYIVYDEALGWTVGPSRRSGDGIHFSSAEGIRAAIPGSVLPKATEKRRIAIVGDSFAFAQYVKFEESFGHLLERAFSPKVEVLNFGVPGYGVDQALVKLETQVLAWKPDVVVFGFPEVNFFRTMTVYPFINWPTWNMPFSKPRFVLNQGELRKLNVPTIPPEKMFAMASISDLPFLQYDRGYNASDWQDTLWDLSYIKRLLTRHFPRWTETPAHLGEAERLRLNREILKHFIRTAEDNGIVPLLVFFPQSPELDRLSKGQQTRAQRTLKTWDVPVLDTTPCLLEAGPIKDVYLPGDPHYSALGNAAVAKCVGAALEPILAKL